MHSRAPHSRTGSAAGPPRLDLNLLVFLDALMTERNVTRAAQRVGLSQAAMSHALGRLRRSLGDPLFVRSGRSMLPTTRARQIAEHVTPALRRIREALASRPNVQPAELAMHVRIMATEYGEITALGGFAARLRHDAPRVVLAVQRTPRLFEVPRAELETGSIEYALGFFDPPAPGSRLLSSSLFADRWVCITRAGDHRRLTLKAFLRHPQMRIAYGGEATASPGDSGLVGEALRKGALRRSVAVIVPHLLTVPFLVVQTGLIGIVPRRLAAALRPALGFEIRTPPIEIPEVRLRLVWHERIDADPAHRWLRQTLVGACAGM